MFGMQNQRVMTDKITALENHMGNVQHRTGSLEYRLHDLDATVAGLQAQMRQYADAAFLDRAQPDRGEPPPNLSASAPPLTASMAEGADLYEDDGPPGPIGLPAPAPASVEEVTNLILNLQPSQADASTGIARLSLLEREAAQQQRDTLSP